jgi:hypothetical protein
MPLCALAVHQLRYYLAFGPQSSARLARDGHAYLGVAEPLVLFVATVGAGAFIGRLARAWQLGGAAGPAARPALRRIWALTAVALVAIYCGQELFEGAVFAGHPAGLAGVVGHGGWIALPLAVGIAGALAALLRVGEALVALAGRLGAGRRAAPTRARNTAAPGRRPHPALDWRLDPGAGISAGRAPPRRLLTA